MLIPLRDQWVLLRRKYKLNSVLAKDPTERTFPCITHVSMINPNRIFANESGIVLHLSNLDIHYSNMTQDKFNECKENCIILLNDYAHQFINAAEELDSPDLFPEHKKLYKGNLNANMENICKCAH